MSPRIPEKHKKPGVCYAVTDEGLELPVIDVIHPAFAVALNESELAALEHAFLQETRRRERLPIWLERLLMRVFLRKSVLASGLQQSTGFLGGVPTYLFKLGPQNLGSYARPIDRRIAEALPALTMRLRLQDMAHMLAEGLAPLLQAQPERPLRFVNIGGGPSIDSLNALLLLNREQPATLQGRSIRIEAFDLDAAGPAFGGRASAALLEAGAPLAGLNVTFTARPYDWTRPETLRAALAGDESLLAVSSEGALFEYASDDVVAANLEALRTSTPPDNVIAGSVTSDNEATRLTHRSSRIRLQPRSQAAFAALVGRAGWKLERCIERPLCFDVLLTRATA